MSGPLAFLRLLAQLLGLIQVLQDRAPDLIGPDDPNAPPKAPNDGGLDPEVEAMIDRGEL